MMKMLPYMDATTVFLVLTLAISLGNVYVPTVASIVNGFASFLPPPILGNVIASIVFLSLIGTIILKVIDAPKPHLYRGGAKGARTREFVQRYGPSKGRYVYGATVGKIKRLREAKRR